MEFAVRILFSALISVAASWGVYNYAPLSFFEGTPTPKFGSTITTIQGSDTLSASRTTINNNFSSLNSDKVGISDLAGTTSLQQLTTLAGLSTTGTITSGTWHGNIVFPTWGGTGSSTLSQYQVLLGNGTGAITVPSGWGTTGQLLASNGAGAAPSWQTPSVNQASDYTWTGLHTFSATTTMATTSIQGVTGGLMPPGSITAYASTSPPNGWLLADGSSLLRAGKYADLFAVIGTLYGASDGSHFNLPNLGGRNILMASTTGNIAQTGGESNHTLTVAEMPAHTHSGGITSGGSSQIGGGSGATFPANTGSAGGDGAHNVLDPYIVLEYIIKY